jgi:non-specific serine/threonine protein kinase
MASAPDFDANEQTFDAGVADAAPASRVPVPLASFVGRETELAEVQRLLDAEGTRLLTLSGPGGVGKTRLALEVARRVEADFADGVRYVSLAPVDRPGDILPAVAQEVAVNERGISSLLDALIDALRDRHLLLVLDNFEHLLEVRPAWLADVIDGAPRIKVLVTSRRPLGVSGEQRYPVAPMPVPDTDLFEEASRVASVALFEQRARSTRSAFALSPDTVASVNEICRRLDGLPLAIELAAARIGVMSPRDIRERLADRSRLLSGQTRDAPRRHRSMHDTIAWSHDLLAAGERRAFRELAVFSGGFRLEAAEQVVQPGEMGATAAVGALVDASLLQRARGNGRDTRCAMLETIRDFGLEQLAASGDERRLRDRHADWCLALARSAEPVDPVVDTTWFDRLEEERANMVAALTWLDACDRLDDFARLLIGTRWLWYPAGREAEGLGWFDRLLARHPGMDDATRGDAMCWRGHLAQMLGRDDATPFLDEALALARTVDDPQRQAVVTEMLAIMAEDGGGYALGESLFRSARELYARAGSDWAFLTIDYHLGIVAYGQQNLARAVAQLDATRKAAEAAGERLVPVWTRYVLALAACDQGHPERAIAVLADQPVDLANGHWHDLPVYVGTVAVIACARGQHAEAARLFGAIARHDATLMLPERGAFERAIAATRRGLGDAAWAGEHARGQRLRREEVEAEIARVLSSGQQVARPATEPSPLAAALTGRERQVLRLLADGLTNQEIGDTLYLSRRTASTHVDHILTKLDVRSRTAAVAFAIRHGLA